LVNGVCVDIECPTGQELVNGVCVDIECPTGQELVNGVCVDIECPTGQELVNGVCVDIEASTKGAGGHEPPTIGKNYAGDNQIVTNGICIDAQCWTVTENFHVDFELVELLTSPHTISNTIFCNEGVQECDYVGVAFTKDFDFNDPVMKVEAKKTNGEWTISWYDPQDFIQDPDDDIPGEITFTAQIIDDNFLVTSFTIVFKNKDTGELVIGIQVRDEERGVRTFWFNEGVEFIDKDRYPYVETAYEKPLDVKPLCLNEDPYYRNSCAFDKVQDWTTKNAEYLLEDILNGNYIYDKYVRDRYYN